MMSVLGVVLFAGGCATEAADPFDAPRALGEAVDALRGAAGYTVSFRVGESTGRAEWFRGGVLKLASSDKRVLRVGAKAWIAVPEGWREAPGEAAGLEHPDELLLAIRLAAGGSRRVARERAGEAEVDVVELAVDSLNPAATVRAWIDGGTLRRWQVAGRAEYAVESVRPVMKLMFDDVPAPWSEEMKKEAAKAVGK
jgi:hypothetical protein